jgi:GxxExxY protein
MIFVLYFIREHLCYSWLKKEEMETEIIYKEESYLIIGKCMEVHNTLDHGFLEIVYKDALELIFRQENIPFQREKEYEIRFRNTVLPHHFFADFVVMDKIILEIKCAAGMGSPPHNDLPFLRNVG